MMPIRYSIGFIIFIVGFFIAIFEEELFSMITDPDLWPQNRDLKTGL